MLDTSMLVVGNIGFVEHRNSNGTGMLFAVPGREIWTRQQVYAYAERMGKVVKDLSQSDVLSPTQVYRR